MYWKQNSQKKWQKNYITHVFNNEVSSKYSGFTNRLISNEKLLEYKKEKLPDKLYKYYSVTSDNILDIKNKRVWLASPTSFNDPYDCSIGYKKEEYEKKQLIKYIEKNNLIGNSNELFSIEELNNIRNTVFNEDIGYSYSSRQEYSSVLYEIVKVKSETFKRSIRIQKLKIKNDLYNKIKELSNANIRVSCFSYFKNDNEFFNKSQMWSHYADNHRGFCVEYDIAAIKENIKLKYSPYEFYNNENEYVEERLPLTLLAGLFPIIYTSRRVRLPYTKLSNISRLNEAEIEEILYKSYITKSSNWNYENEWRLIIEDKISRFYNNKIPFPYISKIYLGCKMSDYDIEQMIELGNELGVEVLKMTMTTNKFHLDYKFTDNYFWENEYKLDRNPYEV